MSGTCVQFLLFIYWYCIKHNRIFVKSAVKHWREHPWPALENRLNSIYLSLWMWLFFLFYFFDYWVDVMLVFMWFIGVSMAEWTAANEGTSKKNVLMKFLCKFYQVFHILFCACLWRKNKTVAVFVVICRRMHLTI